jgi:C-8 sterol isomerase
MSDYIFEPSDLQRIVKMHLDAPLSERFDRIAETLQAVYGAHVQRQPEWIWSNAGGIMCSMNTLHVSPKEYMVFCGTALGTEGHSGRHRAELFDIVINGELRTFKPDQFEATALGAGDMAHLQRRTTNGSHLGKECWLLEYGRGNILSLFPFALGDTIFSTQDLTDLRKTMADSTRLMWSEAKIALSRKVRREGPSAPRLDLIIDSARESAEYPKGASESN